MNFGLLIVFILTGVIHLINTLAYAVRLSGVKTQRLAIALSLFNIIFISSQTANSIQGPLFNAYIESHIRSAQEAGTLNILPNLISWDIRAVLIAATLGTVLGALLIPKFVRVFTKAILIFEQVGSIPRMFLLLFSRQKVVKLLQNVKLPEKDPSQEGLKTGIPRKIIILNVIVTGIYTTGILSAIMAGVMFPEYRATAVQLANLINGVATILLATMIDPVSANITDQAIRGIRAEQDVEKMTKQLAYSRIAGTLFAQVIFIPAAWVVFYMTQAITVLFR